MIKVFQNSTFYILITVFFMIHISCTPPKSFYKMEGSPSLISKINKIIEESEIDVTMSCLLYTSPSPRDATLSRMPSSA